MPSPHPRGFQEFRPTIIDIRQTSPSRTTCASDAYTSDEDSLNHFSLEGSLDMSLDEFDNANLTLATAIIKGLTPSQGEIKRIPTVVLYDDKGLQIYDQITYTDEYYLVQEEIQILQADADHIVDLIPDNSVVVELGSGSLRKTRVLLDSLEAKRTNIKYYALDLMRDELTKSLVSLTGYKNVTTAGLWGTYDEGMTFISSFPADVPKTILWLGSSIGNMTRKEATDFIASYRDILNVGDNWLIGIDRRNSPEEITLAYNDPSSVTQEFIMNGLDHVNRILNQPIFDRSKFSYFGRYDETIGRHEAYYKALESQTLLYTHDGTTTAIQLKKDELINVEYSYKWSLEESSKLFQDTQMNRIAQWASPSKRYDLHMLRKVPFYFKSSLSENSSLETTPSAEEWAQLWSAWNLVTMEMIRHPEMLLEKPIDLRHPFIFYIGHIPAFLDIQLSKVIREPFTEPEYFTQIFERGIDPDVEDPSQCHAHSMVPDKWPEVDEIIAYRDTVMNRLMNLLKNSEKYPLTRRLCRILFMTFEHQAMHLETILYMLVQSPNTRPPPDMSEPCPVKSDTNFPPATWIHINTSKLDEATLSLGHDDLEESDSKNPLDVRTPFGWDNENPRFLPKEIQPFRIQSRQVTNGEFLEFLQATGGLKSGFPKSWTESEDSEGIFVRTVFGLVPMRTAANWPVCCSQKDALGYLGWVDPSGQSLTIPTEHQLSIAFKLKQKALNGLQNVNYGFKAWYPLPSLTEHPVDTSSDWTTFQGPGSLWDWTSTVLAPLSTGFATSALYPGYSEDFFDGKHNVVLGASWATHPCIAERRSFRNWYQPNYEYAFIGFRLVQIMADN